MGVIFGSGATVGIDTVRYYLDTGTGDVRTLSSLCGFGTPDYFSDWWNVNFFAYIFLRQGEGYSWDGCYGRDTWSWYETYAENGSYVNAWGGPSTYNTERGYNNGSFLTFGYGYSYTYTKPYADIMVAVGSNSSSCIPYAVGVEEGPCDGCWWYGRAYNYFGYAWGDHEIRYYSEMGFQNYRYFRGYLFSYSDKRIKENLIKICNIGGINFYKFNYIWDKSTQHVGVIAQELIGTEFDSLVSYDFEKDLFIVNYSKIIEHISNFKKK